MFGPEINEQLQRLERQIADMECRSLTSETEVIDQLRADVEVKQLEIESNIKEMNRIRHDRDSFRSEITVLAAHVEMLKDKLEEAERQRDAAVENLRPTLVRMTQESEAFDRERESLESAILELRKENQSLREENEEMFSSQLQQQKHKQKQNFMKKQIPGGIENSIKDDRFFDEKTSTTENDDDEELNIQQNPSRSSNVNSKMMKMAMEQELVRRRQQQSQQTFGIVPKQLANTLANRHQQRSAEKAKAAPPSLSFKVLQTQQNSLKNQTPYVKIPKAIQSVSVPIAPSPWEAFAVLRNALDAEEKKFRPFVPGNKISNQNQNNSMSDNKSRSTSRSEH